MRKFKYKLKISNNKVSVLIDSNASLEVFENDLDSPSIVSLRREFLEFLENSELKYEGQLLKSHVRQDFGNLGKLCNAENIDIKIIKNLKINPLYIYHGDEFDAWYLCFEDIIGGGLVQIRHYDRIKLDIIH